MKKYLLYELKKSSFVILCITVVMAAVYFIALATEFMYYPEPSSTLLWVIAAAGGVVAAIMPAYVFEYKMKRRSADLYYSLPLSHRHILTVKYILGIIAVFAPYTAVYWLGAFIGMGMAFSKINAVFYLAHFFASIIPIYIIYSISSFIYTRANTAGDGYIFCIFWTFASLLIMTVLHACTNRGDQSYNAYFDPILGLVRADDYIFPDYYTPYMPLNFVTQMLQARLVKGYDYETYYTTAQTVNICLGMTLNVLLSIGATVGLFITEGKLKAENVSQISDSYFGYKVMIPLYTFCLAFLCSGEIVLLILLAIASFLVTVGYKRTLKIGWLSVIWIAAPLVLGTIGYVIVKFA